jgi:hypothetical protein
MKAQAPRSSAPTQAQVPGPAPAGRRKAWLLGTASALVLAGTLATPARSDTTGQTADHEDGPFVYGYTTSLAAPQNSNVTLSSSILNGIGGVTGAGSSAIVTANSYIASTGGNSATSTVSGTTLPLPSVAGPYTVDGLAVLTEAVNQNVVATSLVSRSYLADVLSAASASEVTVSSNTMSATTTLNSASTSVSGQVPAAYASTTNGYSQENYESFYDAGASVVATSTQANLNSGTASGSGAMVTESYTGALITGANDTADTLSGSPAINNNTMAAAYTGNTETTALTLSAGGAPTFTGSAALTNGQVNGYDTGDTNNNPSAVVKYSFIGLGLLPGSGEDASATLTGAVAINNNSETATVFGNKAVGANNAAGNILTLSGGIGVTGTGSFGEDGFVPGPGTFAYFANGEPVTEVYADVLVNNGQVNVQAPLSAAVLAGGVAAVLEAVDGGTVTIANNLSEAQVVGSQATNALVAAGLGAGTGGQLNASFAVNSVQSNLSSPISAETYATGSAIGAGPVGGSTLTESGNSVIATATGNSVINILTLNSSALGGKSTTGAGATTYAERNPSGESPTYTDDFETYATIMLNSLQTNDVSSPITATNEYGFTGIIAGLFGGVSGSTLAVTGTQTSAQAQGNVAGNVLALNAASLSTSAGLLNAQSSYGAVTATLIDPGTGILTLAGDPLSSTLSVTGNQDLALATGNFASNALSATGSYIGVAITNDTASVFYIIPEAPFPVNSGLDTAPQVNAGFVASNDQAVTAAVSAPVTFDFPSMVIASAEGLTGTTANNSQNSIVAQAIGNQASTALTLTPTASLTTYVGLDDEPFWAYTPLAALTNVQQLVGDAVVTAGVTTTETPVKAGAEPFAPIFTGIQDGGLTDSVVTLNGNTISALAQGNNATNALTLAGTGIVKEYGGFGPAGLLAPPITGESPAYTMLTADAAFTLQSIQLSTGIVSASQDGTGVEAAIAGNLTGSTVQVGSSGTGLGNTISGAATTNLANNTVTLSASSLRASTGLFNYQEDVGLTGVAMGEPGALPSAGSTINFNATFTTYMANGEDTAPFNVTPAGANEWTVTEGTLRTSDSAAGDYGWTEGTGAASGYWYKSVTDYAYSGANAPSYGTTVPETETNPGTPGGPGSPGFVISLNGTVTNSVLAITNNVVNASATGNAATNTETSTSSMSYSALHMHGNTPGAYLSPVDGQQVVADLATLNYQELGGTGAVTAAGNGSFWIGNASATPTITGSTLSITGNTVQVFAEGNVANNSTTLSPGLTVADQPPQSASLLSFQLVDTGADAPVTASSNMFIGAPAALISSTLTISGNTNEASAVANDVTNTMTIIGIGDLPIHDTADSDSSEIESTGNQRVHSYGDYTLVNIQYNDAVGPIASTATTTIFNNDLYATTSTLSDATITFDSNTTLAQAIANRSSNMLSVTAGGTLGATAALLNGQYSGSAVTATATLDVVAAVGQQPSTATINNSTFSLTNNTTQALATGNQATNALNVTASAYGSPTETDAHSIANGAGNLYTHATFAVLNSQYNEGPVSATVNGVSPALLPSTINTGQGGYVVALNNTGSGNFVNISGNTITAQAIGNRASNNVMLAALNTGAATSTINSIQQNYGSVTATLANVQAGAGISAGTQAHVTNNTLTAGAYGNVVTNAVVTH